jgi:hypothetical protein
MLHARVNSRVAKPTDYNPPERWQPCKGGPPFWCSFVTMLSLRRS